MRQTAREPARLELSVESPALRADGADLAFVTLRVVDVAGRLAPRARLPVRFELAGDGAILATDNGDATDHTVFASPERKTFNGLALAILRARAGATGELTLTAHAEGLPPATLRLPLK